MRRTSNIHSQRTMSTPNAKSSCRQTRGDARRLFLLLVVGSMALPVDVLAAGSSGDRDTQVATTCAAPRGKKAAARKKPAKRKASGKKSADTPPTSTLEPEAVLEPQPEAAVPATHTPPPPPALTATAETPPASSGEPVEQILARAKELYANLDYADVIPLAVEVVDRPDATIDQRLDGYLLQGSALSVVGDPVEAEKPFRFLLRGRADFDMSADTPPKILAVFRKVQVEERAIVEQMRELARQRAIREIELTPTVPQELVGGQPIDFTCRIKDPRSVVAAADVYYRRAKSDPYSSLAMQIDESGKWVAQLPGQTTENDEGLTIDYYLVTQNAEKYNLVTVGAPHSPLRISVTPGRIKNAAPFYRSWWFWGGTVAAVIVAGTSGYVAYAQANKPPASDAVIDFR